MTHRRYETFGFLLAMLLVGVGAAIAVAQDPFGPGGDAPAEAPAKKDDKKAAGPPPTDDVLILSIRESNPTTPRQLIAAVKALLDYGALDEARIYLSKLLASKPTVGDLADVQRQFGSAFFIRLAAERRLSPEAQRVAAAVMESARRVHTDPDRLRTFAKQTGDADAAKRAEAIFELKNAGAAAVAPLLEVLGNANLPNAQAHARDAIVALGPDAVEPMIGVLDSTNHELRTQAIAVLTRLRTTRLVVYLLRPAFDPDEDPRVQAIAREALKRLMGRIPSRQDVEDYLYKQASDYFAGMSPVEADEDGLATLWRWDQQQGFSVPRYFPANPDAILLPEIRGVDGVIKTIEPLPVSSIMAARVAADLYALYPDVPAYKQLFLATNLEAGKLQVGLGAPLPTGPGTMGAAIAQAGAPAIEDAMIWSIKNDHFIAAIAAAEVLGDIGDASILTSPTGAPRALAVALRHADRRLRFAAADAILKIDPPTSFPGASFVPETLGYLASSVGTRRALVADPRTEVASSFAGLLAGARYDVDLASTGDAALSLALKQPDYEVIFLGDGIDHQDLLRTWQQLRKDPRTANVLVAFLAREENLVPLLEKAETDDLARAMPYVHTVPTLDFQMTQLFRKAALAFVPYSERQRQAVVSLNHMARLASDPAAAKRYDVLRLEPAALSAIRTPGLAPHAAPVLAGLATHHAQLALVELASDANVDIVERQAAAKAFATAVARRGVLLTTGEIGIQYDRYNASETLDPDSQQVLASVLDTIEKKK